MIGYSLRFAKWAVQPFVEPWTLCRRSRWFPNQQRWLDGLKVTETLNHPCQALPELKNKTHQAVVLLTELYPLSADTLESRILTSSPDDPELRQQCHCRNQHEKTGDELVPRLL